MTRLERGRTILRTLELGDADALHALRVRNRAFFEPYEPVLGDDDFTPSAVRASIKLGVDEESEGRSYSFAICVSDTGDLIGRLRLTNVFRGPWQNANLGYYVGREHNGRGHATDAVRLACAFAFREAALHRVQAAVLTDNPRSARVLEKAGFRREGLALRYLNINGAWRDHDIFAMTSEDNVVAGT